MTQRATIAISDEFLTAFARLPKPQQRKVQDFTEKFRRDPSMGSIHYEPIKNMLDKKVRTVRIGDDYRAIVIHPPEGNVYLLVWVDHHDEAMAWARRKRFDIHPATGALQMYEVREGTAPAEAPPARVHAPVEPEDVVPKGRLLAGIHHEDLVILGLPELLLPSVRALRTEVDLDELAPFLPSEARDALYGLAAGQTPNEVLAELDRARAKPKASTAITCQQRSRNHRGPSSVGSSSSCTTRARQQRVQSWACGWHASTDRDTLGNMAPRARDHRRS